MSDYFWLSDEQFQRLAPLLPSDTRGVPRVDELWPMTNLASKHSHPVAERQVVSFCRQPDNNTPEQTPDNRGQVIKHCRGIVAQSIKRSIPEGRMRLLLGTAARKNSDGNVARRRKLRNAPIRLKPILL